MKSPLNRNQLNAATEPTTEARALRRKASHHARCNICGRLYRAASPFHRFCRACRSEDELFKFAEWLPQT